MPHRLAGTDAAPGGGSLPFKAICTARRATIDVSANSIAQPSSPHIVERREFPDACVTTTWTIDLHYPVGSEHFPGQEFRSRAAHLKIQPYAIPYRCLYSRNVENLFMAGRNISVTHVALGTVRVMRTTGMMGEVVGMAASICRRRDVGPRGVYERDLPELKFLMTRGVGKLPIPEEGHEAGG